MKLFNSIYNDMINLQTELYYTCKWKMVNDNIQFQKLNSIRWIKHKTNNND